MFKEKVRDFLYGLFYLDLYRETAKLFLQYQTLINLLIFGDFVGVPMLTSYYSLRLLPYALPQLGVLRREAAREHDVFEELAEYDVH
ncbi:MULTISPECIES: hypothetical protein [Pyrobaculum]|uniref:Uncharacterized protein n=1 Tax=Pyrobaculum arsenaticum (strain DSM 13514 / JCM 11321 / PZ6) TaxID=340102 RepID=A4WJA7_PYRAR|nr:hypothetical protein [Pyrobaculum arsenaticum]ABP50474.1 conserved hypothetical protein [Pyrobaculum arsenaticum DSM 13514]MCY0890467.1 hypothetical protein [Pyrobaculum arsenaticum]